MAIPAAPRSAHEATRFTMTTPQPSFKKINAADPRSLSPIHKANAADVPGRAGAVGVGNRDGNKPSASGDAPKPTFTETPDERVARLRAAHLRARNAKVTTFDKFLVKSRRFCDVAHRVTVMGLIGFSGLAGLATVYTAWDMITYNRKRRAEFFRVQRELEAESLEAARLAYMTNSATPEQIALIEYEQDKNAGQASRSRIFGLPNLISAPTALSGEEKTAEGNVRKQHIAEAATWPRDAAEKVSNEEQGEKKLGGLKKWLFSSLKKEDTAELDTPRAQTTTIQDKAREAFSQEKKNRPTGGLFDRVGAETDWSSSPEQQANVQVTPQQRSRWRFW